MALAFGSIANGPLNEFVGAGPLVRRADEASFPALSTRNESTPAGNTVNVFIDSTNKNMEYAASIVQACKEVTVYAVRCTNRVSGIGSLTCGPNAVEAVLTIGASTYDFSSAVTTSVLGTPVTATLQETCKLAATTAATCAATIKGKAGSESTATSSTVTIQGNTYYRFDMEITGGAEKTANPTGTCGTSAASSFSVKAFPLWALAAVVGAASVLSM